MCGGGQLAECAPWLAGRLEFSFHAKSAKIFKTSVDILHAVHSFTIKLWDYDGPIKNRPLQNLCVLRVKQSGTTLNWIRPD